ncbi:unnamed protein product [Rhizophagus irregularis]|nr:unnamed protein product [Rhizophagus irregularis]
MVYSDPFVHLSITDSHVNYDLPRMRGNETPSDWKDRIWDTLMCNVWFGINIGICYSCNQLVYSKLGSGQSVDMKCGWKMYQIGLDVSGKSIRCKPRSLTPPPLPPKPVALMGDLERYPMQCSASAPEILANRFERSRVLIDAEEYFNSVRNNARKEIDLISFN